MTQTSSTPPLYQQARQARHERQAQQIEEVLALPADQQGQALFQRWPHKLPRLVRHAIDTEVREAWRSLRTEHQDAFWDALCDSMNESSALEAQMHDLRRIHGAKAQEMAQLISRIPNLLKMTVVRQNASRTFNLNGTEDLEDEIFDALCIVLYEGGGIVVRQELPLRSQIIDAQGNKTWVQQNRIYGVYGGQGQWMLMSKSQVRQSFMTDSQTGQPLPGDGFTTFGDIKDFAGKHKALVKH